MQTTATRWMTVTKASKCKFCGALIAWQKSARTGRAYPTKVYTVPGTAEMFTGHNHFHTCRRQLSNEELLVQDMQFKDAFGETERRQEEAAYQREMEEEDRRQREWEEKGRQEYEAKLKDVLVRLHWEEREHVGSNPSAWYDHTYYKVKVDGKIDTGLIHAALTHKWDVGGNAARLGKFGGYCSVGQVKDNGDGTVTIESVYHIGD